MTTLPGQAGSPVIYGDKIIAIHLKTGHRDGKGDYVKLNVGRLITLDVLENLQHWSE
jgi:hypothetical protein